MTAPPPDATRARPRSVGQLFIAFTLLALQGFGGVLAVAQRELVDRRCWLSREEYLEIYSVAQILPGPNVCNLSLMVGERFFGLRGALSALAGMLVVPMILVLVLAAVSARLAEHPMVAGALHGMGAVATGLLLAMTLKLALALRSNPMGTWLCAAFALAAVLCVAVWRLPLVLVVPALGALGWLVARRAIARREGR